MKFTLNAALRRLVPDTNVVKDMENVVRKGIQNGSKQTVPKKSLEKKDEKYGRD